MARRYLSLHHNLQEGENVIFHREHRSKKGRSPLKPGKLQKFDRSTRRKWKNFSKSNGFMDFESRKLGKKKRY